MSELVELKCPNCQGSIKNNVCLYCFSNFEPQKKEQAISNAVSARLGARLAPHFSMRDVAPRNAHVLNVHHPGIKANEWERNLIRRMLESPGK